jgi:hypothetical protein|eukprot:SAG25_NODE_88_length_16343_cov_89.495383_6_plen_50_part_00
MRGMSSIPPQMLLMQTSLDDLILQVVRWLATKASSTVNGYPVYRELSAM